MLVTPRERDRLERDRVDLVDVLDREADDGADLVVVDRIHNRDYQRDVHPGGVQMLDRFQLHIEQVVDGTVGVLVVADAVELQVGEAQAGLVSFRAKSGSWAKRTPLVAHCTEK